MVLAFLAMTPVNLRPGNSSRVMLTFSPVTAARDWASGTGTNTRSFWIAPSRNRPWRPLAPASTSAPTSVLRAVITPSNGARILPND